MSPTRCLFSVLLILFVFRLSSQCLPPDAQPGKCYAMCIFADQFETVTEQITIKPASKRTMVAPPAFEDKPETVTIKEGSKRIVAVPAEYTTVTEKILAKDPSAHIKVKEESKRFVEIPAVYETVSESYEIEPAYTKYEILEPRFETVTEGVETKPATTKWVKKQADANCLSADPNDCIVWCLVETPAEFKTVTKRVNKGCDGSGKADAGCIKTIEVPAKTGMRTLRKVKTQASVREETVPAEFKTVAELRRETAAGKQAKNVAGDYLTIRKQVVKTPASTREEEIQPVTQTFNTRALKTPAALHTEDVPAETTPITKRKLVKPGGFNEWREVLCGEKVTGYTVEQIQQALIKAGYDPGPADNVMGAATKRALEAFQRDRNLPVGNLDLETLKALGVNF